MDEKFKDELNSVTQNLTVSRPQDKSYKKFNYATYPILENEAIYALDLKYRTVSFQRGIYDLMGYTEEEFDFDLVFSMVHPDDIKVVRKVLMSTLAHSKKYGISTDSVFRISFRARKKDGSYIKIQRISGISRLNPNQSLRGHYSIIQDISYLGLSNAVKWDWNSPTADLSGYRKYVDVSPTDLFSNREQEVFGLLKNGLNSKAIAQQLGLSHHTIIGYRKNMLHKSNCRNTFELLQMFELGSLYNVD